MGRIVCTVLFTGLLLSCSSLPAEAAKLLILPFEISSQEPLDYLKDSLPDLLASRIGQAAEVTVVPPAKVKEALQGRQVLSLTDQEAQALARSLGADYLLFGRFTKIGDAFSLDAAVLDLSTGRLLGRFLADGEGTSQIIPKIGELTESLRKRFTTLVSPSPLPPAAGRFTPAPLTPAPSATRPPSPVPAPPPPAAMWTSRQLALEARGIGVGDVNHDGTDDIVILTKQEIHVYRWQGQDLQLLTRYPTGASLECVGVDVADLNGNGLAEIYVTALGPARTLSSFVLEWSGSGLRPVVSGLPWYLRLVRVSGATALLGQAPGYETAFAGPVRRFVWRGGQLVAGEPLSLPAHVSLYSFALEDLDADGVPEVASVQSRTPLTVYGPRGAVLGRGARYGQSALYVVEKPSVNEDTEEGLHLPGRVLVANLPGHGTALLVSRNHESLGIFNRLKTFTNGEVIAVRWSQEDLEEVWRTESLAYVADFQMASLPPQGEPVLIVATVSEFGGVFDSPRSRLVFVPLAGVSR